MRLKHIKNAETIIYESPYLVKNPTEYKGKWNTLFNNNNPIEIEIGMGKGKFITSLAQDNPNINYIGIEKYATPIVAETKRLADVDLKNLKIICFDAFNINDVFDHEIEKIYLNFSDPWPKTRHEKRRLTSKIFLDKYDHIFKDKKRIQMKTDNDLLYEYSLESFISDGYDVIKTETSVFDKYTTEYEDKFLSTGKNINYIYVEKI